MARLGKYTEAITYVDATTGALMPAANATAYIYEPDTVVEASVWDVSTGAGAAVTQPITIGADGMLEFYVKSKNRRFDIKVTAGAAEFSTFTLADQAATFDDTAFYSNEYDTLATALSEMSEGDKLIISEDTTLTATLSISSQTNITIEGEAKGVTLTADTDLNADLISVVASTGIIIRNLTLNGNSANQSGAGPYQGVAFDSGAGSSRCALEDLEITDMKGDGVQYENTTDLVCSRVLARSCKGYGFFHGADSVNRAIRPTFTDCLALTCGTDLILARNSGWYAAPSPDAAAYTKCKAITNGGHGFAFVSTSAVATVEDIELDSCRATGNGTVAGNWQGLYVYTDQANHVLSRFKVTGGDYSENDQDGIHFETDTASSAQIWGWTLNGPTCIANGRSGIELIGFVLWGSATGPVCLNNGPNGYGIRLSVSTDGIKYPNNNSFLGFNCSNSSGADQDYGVDIAASANSNTFIGGTATSNAVGEYRDQGNNNVILGSTPQSGTTAGGFLAFYHGDNFSWFDVSATAVDGGSTSSASAVCSRVTANTRIVSLVPIDYNGGMMLHGSRGGWYHVPAENTAESHVTLRFIDYPLGQQYGSFSVLLMEPVET